MKKLIALLLALVMVLGLAACGGSNAAGNEDAPASVEVSEEFKKLYTKPTEDVSLEVWYAVSGVTAEKFEALVNEYVAANPNVKVELSYAGSYADAASKISANQLTGTAPDLALISGQQPVPTYAKKSVANFKLRQGMKIGVKVTLRGDKMYEFLDRLFNFALPRVRDFKGINPDAFDGRGNYALGLKEQLIFPEIEYDKVDKIRGMDIAIVTTAQTDAEAKELLTMMGAPFEK